jgi:hypothetical protein
MLCLVYFLGFIKIIKKTCSCCIQGVEMEMDFSCQKKVAKGSGGLYLPPSHFTVQYFIAEFSRVGDNGQFML